MPWPDAREAQVIEALLHTQAPEAGDAAALMLTALMETPDPAARATITARFEYALAQRSAGGDLAAVLGLNALGTWLDRAGWATLSAAMPSVAGMAALAQLLCRGDWTRPAAALPALAAWLPSLRTQSQFELLLQLLPAALRDSLAALHAWVEQADASMLPRLHVDPLTALAVTALLWRLERALPRPAAPQQGLARFVAQAPHHWQRLSGLNRVAGALLAPVAPPPASRGITHLPATEPRIVPRPAALADVGGRSGAGRPSDSAVMAFGAGVAGAGLLMIRQGWQWLSGVQPPAPPPPCRGDGTPGTGDAPVAGMIALLDEIADVDGGDTVWQDLRARIHHGARDDSNALAAQVQERLIANDLVDQALAHGRSRRSPVNDHSPQATLNVTSHQLVQSVRTLPAGSPEAEDVVSGNESRLSLAMARLHLREWLYRKGSSVTDRQAALADALRFLAFSDKRLEQVSHWLPNLDRYIGATLVQQIRQVTNTTVDPDAIYRNTFTEHPCWPEWEAGQTPSPDPELRDWYSGYPRTRRVRSGLVSSHTLVQAALLPPEVDGEATALYDSGMPGTYFPREESALQLWQFNEAINGSDYLGDFREYFDVFTAACGKSGVHLERDAYVDALARRLAGTGVLLNAMAQLTDAGKWLLDTLLRYPGRFGTGPDTLGRALALPGQDIQVNALGALPAHGNEVALHGLLLARSNPSAERSQGAVLVIAPSRRPLVQEFDSPAAALRHLREELPQQLHSWVPVQYHARWAAGNGPVVVSAAVDGNFMEALLQQQLALRSQHLHHMANNQTAPAEARKDYLALDRRLLALPLPVEMSMLEAAYERVSNATVEPYPLPGTHWLAGSSSRTLLRNAEREDAYWLGSLSLTRSLVRDAYPLPSRYVAGRLEEALLNRTGIAIDTRDVYLVRFSGGSRSEASPSGFTHSAMQKVGACRLVECAFNKAKGYPDGTPGSYELGLYTSANSTVFDQDTEVGDLLPGAFIAAARSLDLRSGYLQAINDFWTDQRDAVKVCLRGVYMFSAWQQYAEGSLSARGLRMAIAATGYMLTIQAEDPAFVCRATDGTRVSWVSVYGTMSTLMRIDHVSWPEVVLYAPGDPVAFREFSDAAQWAGWMTRVVATDTGRRWLEAAFDLADLQDGWFSNGVDTALGQAQADLFQGNQSALAISGDDLFAAMVSRLETRTLNDADVLLMSDTEALLDTVQARVQEVDLILGFASIAFPPLLPILVLGSLAEVGLGVEKAIEGRTAADRHEGAVDAGWGALGVALSAPFAMAHAGALSGAEGMRLAPEVKMAAEVGVADPLAALAGRYGQPANRLVEGARPTDNGIHHYAGRHFIRQSGTVYEVTFDAANRTWRLKNPNPGSFYQTPVRLNAQGVWEPHSNVGLRGGAPDELPAVSRSTSIDSSYRGLIASQLQRLSSTRSLDSASADFRWGMTHWERVMLPEAARESMSVQEMKQLVVSGQLDPVQRGALSVVIARIERNLRMERSLRLEEAVFEAVEVNGGHLFPVSQTLLDTRSGVGMGLCTGLSRVMAVALAEGKEAALIKNLRAMLRRPDEGLGAELLAHVRDAQGAVLLPGAASAHAPIDFADLAGFMAGSDRNALFMITGAHSMVGSVRVLPNGRKVLDLFDPNIGLIRFYRRGEFNRMLRHLFSSRYFSALSTDGRSGARETLAELYGARQPTAHSSPSEFMIRQLDPEKLVRQARGRGWDRLLEDVPA